MTKQDFAIGALAVTCALLVMGLLFQANTIADQRHRLRTEFEENIKMQQDEAAKMKDLADLQEQMNTLATAIQKNCTQPPKKVKPAPPAPVPQESPQVIPSDQILRAAN